MEKNCKKLLTLSIVVAMVIGAAATLAGCGKDQKTKDQKLPMQ